MSDRRSDDFVRGGTEAGAGGEGRREGQDRRLSTDTACKLLADRRRRIALSYLRGSDRETVSFDRLAAAVTAGERAAAAGADDDVALTLRHDHLPRLAAAGVVAYDHGADEISYVPTDPLEAFLDVAADERSSI